MGDTFTSCLNRNCSVCSFVDLESYSSFLLRFYRIEIKCIREAFVQEKCSFFNIVQTGGGGGVKLMFKNYVVNFV